MDRYLITIKTVEGTVSARTQTETGARVLCSLLMASDLVEAITIHYTDAQGLIRKLILEAAK